MSTSQTVPRDTSPLESVPTSDEIRLRLNRNASENRLLRSLYKLVRKIEARRQGNLKGI
jgi:hypothetical protein